MTFKYQRSAPRSPFKKQLLFEHDGNIFKCRAFNISNGGMYLGCLPIFPSKEVTSFILSLPSFPTFSDIHITQLKKMDQSSFKSSVFRVKAQILRRFDSQSEVDKVFSNFVGVKFVQIDEIDKEKIDRYVETYFKNIVHLLALFEKDSNALERIRLISKLLMYEEDDMEKLRFELLHEYQNLLML